jgi:hypothetical protein
MSDTSPIMPKRAKYSENAPDDAKATFSGYYPVADLRRLAEIEEKTGINAREYLRILLTALIESYDATGRVVLPLAVVPRDEAETCGLLKAPSQPLSPPEALRR